MKKIFRILTVIITVSMIFALASCKKENAPKEGESYAISENGLYSFIYSHDDYEYVSFSGGESTFVIDNILIEVKSVEDASSEPSFANLDEFCATLPYYEKYAEFFKDFDFSAYSTATLNKMKNVRYYEKHMEAQDADLEMKPSTVQVYIFKGNNAHYIITAGYMDYAKDEAEAKIKKLIDTFEEMEADAPEA